jgi:isorenieratene synthase
LKEATVLHRQLVNQKELCRLSPRQLCQPAQTTTTAVPNLMFAGDWVRMPFPCGLMERAVSSGLLAANAIFEREGVQRRTILSVDPEGVLKI